MDEAEYLARICRADQDLLSRSRRQGPGRCGEAQHEESPAWPEALEILLRESSPAKLLEIQYATERHYAQQLKSTDDHILQDELLALAYMRVVRLQFLRQEMDMGFSERQLRFVLAAMRPFQNGAGRDPDILEIGCGAGSLLEHLAKSGFRSLAGIDLAPSAVELTRRRLAPFGLAGNVQQAATPHLLRAGRAENFDVVLLCDVIEHIPPDRAGSLLTDVRTLLRPGGRLIAITPNAFAGPHDITRQFQAPGSKPEGLHLHEYSLRELTALLTTAGFSCLTALRLRNCLPWTRELRLSAPSVRIRLAIERVFPYLPRGLTAKTADKLYFSGLCGQVAPSSP